MRAGESTDVADVVRGSFAITAQFARLAAFVVGPAILVVAEGEYGATGISDEPAGGGDRDADGAGRGQVLWMVLRVGLVLVAVGSEPPLATPVQNHYSEPLGSESSTVWCAQRDSNSRPIDS